MSSSQSHNRQKSNSQVHNKVEIKPDSNESYCLYIGNIDKKCTTQQLKTICSQHGQLEYCYIVYQPYSGTDSRSKEIKVSRGYGFAHYFNTEHAIKAKQKLDGFDINGRKIKIQFSKRSKPRQATPGRYLGKKKNSPKRYKDSKRSYSRSSSDSYRHRKRDQYKRRKKHYESRSRSYQHRRKNRKDSYSHSPRR